MERETQGRRWRGAGGRGAVYGNPTAREPHGSRRVGSDPSDICGSNLVLLDLLAPVHVERRIPHKGLHRRVESLPGLALPSPPSGSWPGPSPSRSRAPFRLHRSPWWEPSEPSPILKRLAVRPLPSCLAMSLVSFGRLPRRRGGAHAVRSMMVPYPPRSSCSC